MSRTLTPPCFLILPLSLLVIACGASDSHRQSVEKDGGSDAGAGGSRSGGAGGQGGAVGAGGARAAGGTGSGGTSSGGTSSGGTSSGGVGGSGGAPPDAASLDSGVEAGPDSGVEAGSDAGGDSGNPLIGTDVIYATFNGMLVWLDPENARLTEVGLVRNATNEAQVYRTESMTWSRSGATALTALGNTRPTLATVDLCTGLATLGPAVTRAATPNPVLEGVAVAADGTVYVGSGNSTQSLSPNLGTLDVGSGVVTSLGGSVTTFQNDIDMVFFVGPTLYGMDVDTNANRLDLFTLNPTTGLNTRVVAPSFSTTPDVPLRFTYSERRGTAYGWRPSDRNLLEIDLATGTPTRALGETHPAGTYGNQPSYGFFVAPLPACP